MPKVTIEVSADTFRSARAYAGVMRTSTEDELGALIEYARICRARGFEAAEVYRIGREERGFQAGTGGMTTAELRAHGIMGGDNY